VREITTLGLLRGITFLLQSIPADWLNQINNYDQERDG